MSNNEDENQKVISTHLRLKKYFYKFTNAAIIASYFNQSEELQYLDTKTSNPGPSKAPSTPKRVRGCRRKLSYEEASSSRREVPRLLLKWPEGVDIFKNMASKELASSRVRDPKLFVNQSTLMPTMRLIVLDWLMEICKIFKFRRRAYHLAVDYIDRYLSINAAEVSIEQYKLIGVTCLFIAIKLEERYPPELSSLPSTPDNALTHDKIRTCEKNVLKSLDWDIDHMTPDCWLNLYLQIHAKVKEHLNPEIDKNIRWDFIYPIYSAYEFVHSSQIIDLFSMDPAYLQYPYSVIAAAAVYFTHGKDTALSVSGLPWKHMQNCVKYMSAFYKVIRTSVDPRLKSIISLKVPANYAPNRFRIQLDCGALKKNIPNLLTTDEHSIQTHCVDIELYVEATLIHMKQLKTKTTEKESLAKKKRPAAAETQDNAKKTTQEEATKVMFDVKNQKSEKLSTSLPVTGSTVEEDDKENQVAAGNTSF